MNVLEKLNLPRINNIIVEDFNDAKKLYNIATKNLKIKKQKEILCFIFDTFVSYFNLGYDIKLKFDDEDEFYDENIHLEDITQYDFDTAFYLIYSQCLKKYLIDLYKIENKNIDPKLYTIVRLAILNNDEEVIMTIINNSYCKMIDERFDIVNPNIEKNISENKIAELITKNKIRNNKLKIAILSSSLEQNIEIANLYKCMSSEIFNELNKEEKAYLMTLIYSCFHILENNNINKKFNRLINKNTSNQEALEILINNLIIEGRTMYVKKRNLNIVEDILSWLPYSYMNEIELEKINSLKELENIKNQIKTR